MIMKNNGEPKMKLLRQLKAKIPSVYISGMWMAEDKSWLLNVEVALPRIRELYEPFFDPNKPVDVSGLKIKAVSIPIKIELSAMAKDMDSVIDIIKTEIQKRIDGLPREEEHFNPVKAHIAQIRKEAQKIVDKHHREEIRHRREEGDSK